VKPAADVVRESGLCESPRDGAELVLNWSLDALENGDQAEVEAVLEMVNVDATPAMVLVSWLVGSLQIADCSRTRNEFLRRVRERFDRDLPLRSEALLRGLGPEGARGAREGDAMIRMLTERGGT
jgi:hypothetical protein